MRCAVSFEPMGAADLPQVMEIERLAFQSPWTPGLFLHELKRPFSRLRLVRSAKGAVVGYVCWWVIGGEIHVPNLAVHPHHRRNGIGRALVQLVLDEALRDGAATVSLEVRPTNQAALTLYRSLGFSEAGMRRNYYGQGQDAIIMARELAGKQSAAAPELKTPS